MSILTEQQAQLAMVSTWMLANDDSPPVMPTARQAAQLTDTVHAKKVAALVKEASQKGLYDAVLGVANETVAKGAATMLKTAGYTVKVGPVKYGYTAEVGYHVKFEWSN